MEGIFLRLLNMSIQASVLIVIIVFLRIVLKKSPKWLICLLWALVAVRLAFPFTIESRYSLAPNANVISADTNAGRTTVASGVTAIDEPVNRYIEKSYGESAAAPVQKVTPSPVSVISGIWIAGMAALALYAVLSYLKVWLRVRFSINLHDNVWICDGIDAPFIFGVIRPRIYLPSRISEEQAENVILHENAHLKRRDYIWKPLGFLLLTVYWFNPFCWLAYILFCRDIELACDEKVIRDLSMEQKKVYSKVLLSFSEPQKKVTVCPLAFGEVGVKQRIKSVLSYKKPTFWIVGLTAVAGIVVAVFFMTNPKQELTAEAGTEETQTDTEKLQADTEEAQTGTELQADTEEVQSELTMQALVQAVTSEDWNSNQKSGGIDPWRTYGNLDEDKVFHEDSLTGLLRGTLTYDGKTYELQVYYWPKDTAGEYGKEADSVENILLLDVATGDGITLYNDEDTVDEPDIEEFLLRKYELPQELAQGNYDSSKLTGNVTLGDYRVDLFLNFAGSLFENSSYEEPAHGDWTPDAWYFLGGVGVCSDAGYADFETFENGKLTGYDYTDNHMGCEKVQTFTAGEYSGCLYRYEMDLVTASETDVLETGESGVSDYWVLFFTKGEGEPLYMKFFNCDYYSKEEALESIGAR